MQHVIYVTLMALILSFFVAWQPMITVWKTRFTKSAHHCHSPSEQRRRGRPRPIDREYSHTADATGNHAGVMGSGWALWVAEREALGTGVVERGGVDITGQSLGEQSSITTHLWRGKKNFCLTQNVKSFLWCYCVEVEKHLRNIQGHG